MTVEQKLVIGYLIVAVVLLVAMFVKYPTYSLVSAGILVGLHFKD